MAGLHFERLYPLQNLQESDIETLFVEVANRNLVSVPEELINSTSELMHIDDRPQSRDLIYAISNLLFSVRSESFDIQSLSSTFPGDFPDKLKSSITKIITKNADKWKNKSESPVEPMPRLVDFDYQIAHPNCRLTFDLATDSGVEKKSVLMNEQQLDLMIEGLGKIRDQLFASTK